MNTSCLVTAGEGSSYCLAILASQCFKIIACARSWAWMATPALMLLFTVHAIIHRCMNFADFNAVASATTAEVADFCSRCASSWYLHVLQHTPVDPLTYHVEGIGRPLELIVDGELPKPPRLAHGQANPLQDMQKLLSGKRYSIDEPPSKLKRDLANRSKRMRPTMKWKRTCPPRKMTRRLKVMARRTTCCLLLTATRARRAHLQARSLALLTLWQCMCRALYTSYTGTQARRCR